MYLFLVKWSSHEPLLRSYCPLWGSWSSSQHLQRWPSQELATPPLPLEKTFHQHHTYFCYWSTGDKLLDLHLAQPSGTGGHCCGWAGTVECAHWESPLAQWEQSSPSAVQSQWPGTTGRWSTGECPGPRPLPEDLWPGQEGGGKRVRTSGREEEGQGHARGRAWELIILS